MENDFEDLIISKKPKLEDVHDGPDEDAIAFHKKDETKDDPKEIAEEAKELLLERMDENTPVPQDEIIEMLMEKLDLEEKEAAEVFENIKDDVLSDEGEGEWTIDSTVRYGKAA